MKAYLTAEEAARRLGVTRATLYAYVSRGLIRSRLEPGQRRRQYHLEDVVRWQKQKAARRDPTGLAHRALSVEGLPVLTSALTLIDGGRIYYRGQDAVALSARARFEEVVGLLWGAEYAPQAPAYKPTPKELARLARLPFAAACQAYLAQAQALDLAAYNLSPDAVRRTGARILAGMSMLAAGGAQVPISMGAALASAWGAATRSRTRAIEAALILCADHELNVSAFTARAIASAGATPYMAVSGALGALSGHRHGGILEHVAALLDDDGDPAQRIAERLRLGQPIPGFGHALYPEGDPRGRALLDLCPRGPTRTRVLALASAARRLVGEHPTLDLGLLSLARCLGLPSRAPFVLFALGRSAGWLAHCLEQYATGELIRPRARYVGPEPGRRAEPVRGSK